LSDGSGVEDDEDSRNDDYSSDEKCRPGHPTQHKAARDPSLAVRGVGRAALVHQGHTAAVSLFSEYPVMRTVPDFIGLSYDEATALEVSVGLRIADPNPDAPPISNYWWEHKELVVLTQSPPSGCSIDPQGSVAVTLGPPQVAVGARVQTPVPPALSAEAQAEPTASERPPASDPAEEH
jgi:beta-lactam-binding protein with PASTA domain